MADSIALSQSTADAFSRIGIGDFNVIEQPERMAWVVAVLRRLPDRLEWFPRGKWATIQQIEMQVDACAGDAVIEIVERLLGAGP